ncbi:MAG: VWA domain-containing protein [Gammaproteobacteria bacterium]|nr:VWA domain-containing protein [Gammaproteobacteria bacterium]
MKTITPFKRNLTTLLLTATIVGCSSYSGQSTTDSNSSAVVPQTPDTTTQSIMEYEYKEVRSVENRAVPMAHLLKQEHDRVALGKEKKVIAMEMMAPSKHRVMSQAMASAEVSGHYLADQMIDSNSGIDREQFAEIIANGIKRVSEDPVSTLSIDVDSGAYSLVRRNLNQGVMPRTDMVRIEEMINYFDYSYPQPEKGGAPFSVTTEVSKSPWNSNSHLVHVGIQGIDTDKAHRPASNLVFLIDVSGSMGASNKLPLLKSAFKLLVKQLNEKDRVTMVVYAGASGVVLESTSGNEQGKIIAALDRLNAGGSTHGSAGINLAYAMAEQAKIEGGINRVILATDGDFNVGTVNHTQLMDLIEAKRKAGISLTTLGFGSGNYNDHLMEQLADKGNGNYAYIDNINEAQKVLVDELTSTLKTIAKDVKIQVEWNPAVVSEYRLIGYNNRLLNREDFNNDKIDAGEIGAGHSVTALYEVTLANSDQPRIDPLRYQREERTSDENNTDEIAFLRLRYKEPDADHSKLIEQVISHESITHNINQTSDNYRFSAAVAGFGQLLRGGQYTGQFDYAAVKQLASGARGQDEFGYRGEFVRLVNLASGLSL